MINTTKTWSPFDIATYNRNGQILQNALNNNIAIYSLENANNYTYEPYTDTPLRSICQNYLAIDELDEGCKMRFQGLNYPILVINLSKLSVAEIVKMLLTNYLAQSISSLSALKELQGKVMLFGGVLKVHLNVVINSSGFDYNNTQFSFDDLVAAISLTGIYCEGIYTELDKNDSHKVNSNKIQELIKLASKLEYTTGKTFAIKHYFMK